MNLKYKIIGEHDCHPVKAHDSDACFDLFATEVQMAFDGIDVSFGVAFEIPEGHAGLLFSRSSIKKTDYILSNCVGVIDSGYRGEVSAKFKTNKSPVKADEYFQVGNRVAQIMLIKLPNVKLKQVKELSSSDRGEGGFGSSGLK